MGILYLEMWALEEKDKPMIRTAEIIKNPTFQDIATQVYLIHNIYEEAT